MIIWLLLKLLHVVFGMFWAGSVIFLAGFLLPVIRTVGPEAGPVMRGLIVVRRMPQALVIAAWVTVITGLLFYVRLGVFSGAPLLANWHGWVLVLGSTSGVLGLVLGVTVQAPAAARMSAITAGLRGPPSPEQQAEIGAMQQRLDRAGRLAVVLVLIAVAGMALSHPIQAAGSPFSSNREPRERIEHWT